MYKHNFFAKKDIIVIFAVLLTAVIIFVVFAFYTKGKSEYVQIIYNNSIIDELPLNEDTIYIPETNSNVVIEIKDNKVHFKSSDCPDKVCVNTGWLSQPGQTAVCLPNRLSIVVKAAKSENAVDTEI